MRPIIKRIDRSGLGLALSAIAVSRELPAKREHANLWRLLKKSSNTSNLDIRRNLKPQQFGNSCLVNFRSQMCRGFTLEHQDIKAKSISIEAKIRTKLLRATRRNNRCSSWQAIENII
ncbi:hypothetical protein [Microcoleus sp. herbarium14]|uniref:hypothetical protein n=1 Tax=Microcoleus sp. herbarium14 TaxID=3055439 RepID=UPI002FD79AD9